jgi:hypothetical protein
MLFLASLILFAIPSSVVVDEVYQIPADDWSYVDLGPVRQPAIVKADISVEAGLPMRLILIERREFERMSHGENYIPLRSIASRGGGFEQRVNPPGDYIVALDNRGSRQSATVHLRILLDSSDPTQLSPERRLVVIAISFAVFIGMAGFSAIKLWRAANPRV